MVIVLVGIIGCRVTLYLCEFRSELDVVSHLMVGVHLLFLTFLNGYFRYRLSTLAGFRSFWGRLSGCLITIIRFSIPFLPTKLRNLLVHRYVHHRNFSLTENSIYCLFLVIIGRVLL